MVDLDTLASKLIETYGPDEVKLFLASTQTPYDKFKKKYFKDPAGFVLDCFKWKQGEGPSFYQLDILNRIITEKRVSVRGPHGLGKCLAFDEDIRLADGSYYKCQDLIGKSFQVNSVDTDFNVNISNAICTYNGIKDVVRITTTKGRVIVRTLNHPLWVDTDPYKYISRIGNYRLDPKGSWVPAENITKDSVIAISCVSSDNEEYSITDDEIKVAAYLIADGSLLCGVRYTKKNTILIEELSQSCRNLGCDLVYSGHNYEYRIIASENCDHSKYGQPINPILNKCREWNLASKNSHTKFFPDWVWKLSNRQMCLFLNRLFSGDGWVCENEIGYSSVSKELAVNIHRALLHLGIQARLSKGKTNWTHNGVKKIGYSYNVTLHSVPNVLRFIDKIGIFGKQTEVKRVKALYLRKSESKQQSWQNKNLPDVFKWEKIKSVEILKNVETVSIHVPGDETFLTDFVEHNSAMASWVILWFALTRDGKDWKCPTTASAWRQLTRYLWPEVHKWSRLLDWDKVGREPFSPNKELLTLNLKLSTGESFAVASDIPELIEGAHADELLYIFDESKSISDNTFDAAEGAFSGAGEDTKANAYALAISTPGSPIGRFYDIHQRKLGYEDWYVKHVTLEDCIKAGRISRQWAEQKKRQWGENSSIFQNRVKGEFASDSEDTVIPLSWIELANQRWEEWQDSIKQDIENKGRLLYLGVDVGGGGENSDKSIIAPVHEGYKVDALRKYERGDIDTATMELTGRVVAILRANKGCYAFPDIIGIGLGVYNRLKEMWKEEKEKTGKTPDWQVEPFNAAESKDITDMKDESGELGFVNKRSAAWWKVRELLSPTNDFNVCLPRDDDLIGELTAPKSSVRSGGKIYVEAKEDIKKRLHRSTDSADAVIQGLTGIELCNPKKKWRKSKFIGV